MLFGCNQDSSTTTFSDIRRLPPAHRLTCSSAGLALQRYWTLPIEEPVYYRDDREYIERFRGLLHEAVADRLRTNRVSVFMSGGLDSPALAATAVECLKAPDAVQAFTLVYDWLIPDSERQYACKVAKYLNIPIQVFALDEETAWALPGSIKTPEPAEQLSNPAVRLRYYRSMATHSRVALYGEGPDNALLYDWRPHLAWLGRKRRWGRLLLDVGHHLASHKRVPLLPSVPRMLQDWRKRNRSQPVFPDWLNRRMVDRLGLRERWSASSVGTRSMHPVRPRAYSSLVSHLWPLLFEELEPPYTGAALEVRHPYVDVRLLRFLLTMPALPWCRNKHLLRSALRGVIPEVVRQRPKTPLQKKPDFERAGAHGMPPVLASTRLAAYCDSGRVNVQRSESVASFYADSRASALSYWLHDLDSIHIDKEGDSYVHREDTVVV